MNDIVAAETPFSNLIAMGIYVGVALLALIIIGVIIARLYQRASKEIAFVRTGFGGEKVVINGGALVLPRNDAGQHEYRASRGGTQERGCAYHA